MTGTSFLRRLHRTSGRELADFVEALGALVALRRQRSTTSRSTGRSA